jgi:hypothetical protein
MKPIYLNKKGLVQSKEVVKDSQFRNHLKDSVVSAGKAGVRARTVVKQKESKTSRHIFKGLIFLAIGISLGALLLKKKA